MISAPAALTYSQAAEALGVSDSTIKRLVRRGALRTLHIGRLARISPAAIAAFVADREEAEAWKRRDVQAVRRGGRRQPSRMDDVTEAQIAEGVARLTPRRGGGEDGVSLYHCVGCLLDGAMFHTARPSEPRVPSAWSDTEIRVPLVAGLSIRVPEESLDAAEEGVREGQEIARSARSRNLSVSRPPATGAYQNDTAR